MDLLSNLHTMMSAGIPIIDTIDTLLADAKGNEKLVLITLRDGLGEGKSISDVLASSRLAFDDVTISLIRSSEVSGTLEQTLDIVVTNIKSDIAFIQKARNALIYPLFILSIFIFVVIFMLVYVIPNVATVFKTMNSKLPIQTVLLINVSAFILQYWPLLVGGIIAIILFFILLYQTRRRFLLQTFYSLPFLYPLARDIDIVRITRNMSYILRSGISLTQAIELCVPIATQPHVRQAFENSLSKIAEGKSFAESLEDISGTIPVMVRRMVQAGERSGALEQSLIEISRRFEDRVTSKLQVITILIEPVIMLLIGVSVGAVMLGIISPIYNLIGNIASP